jgi:hydrogenase maturation protein HypF
MKACKISITGTVQGVGFRPFVFKTATEFGIRGWIINTNEGVIIHAEGSQKSLGSFLRKVKRQSPVLCSIATVSIKDCPHEDYTDFTIRQSRNRSSIITGISPDVAVCHECMVDVHDEGGTRHLYPLVNCTNCGPRFSIILGLPYDRNQTTMAAFHMCPECKKEYDNPADRRFHAQPIACNICGPSYELWQRNGVITDMEQIIRQVSEAIDNGKIIALKGMGGFHLACNAFDTNAVTLLRNRKQRDSKPFAIMFRNMAVLRSHVRINKTEARLLQSWRRPIVLLHQKKTNAHTSSISSVINEGLARMGIMLPYMPFHYLLFERLKTDAIVLTSGNLSEEPIVIENSEAINRLSPIADYVVTHQREIYNRVEDSVVHVIAGKTRLIRRCRGYVPEPVNVPNKVDGIVAFGAELVNTFCVGKGHHAYLSPHIGDLKNLRTFEFFEITLQRFIDLFRIMPSLLVCDKHPDYWSTTKANEFRSAAESIPLMRVQHHHAHIASCMAEHGIRGRVIGVAFDGTGYGDDGTIWGSEFFSGSVSDLERESHFDYVPLPGGDMAIAEPWRIAISILLKVYGTDFLQLSLPLFSRIGYERMKQITHMIRSGINCPMSCGAGRWFDGISALLGLCVESGYEAEAPMKLEALANLHVREKYPVKIGKVIILDEMIRQIVSDINSGIHPGVISARFHNTIISTIFETVKKISAEKRIRKVVLSGGVFLNRIILGRIENLLMQHRYMVYTHTNVPTNDGGIALGQLFIASERRKQDVSWSPGKSH